MATDGADSPPDFVTDSDSNDDELQSTNNDEPMVYGDQGTNLTKNQWKCAAGETAYWDGWHKDAWAAAHSSQEAPPPPPPPWRVEPEVKNDVTMLTGTWKQEDDNDEDWDGWEDPPQYVGSPYRHQVDGEIPTKRWHPFCGREGSH